MFSRPAAAALLLAAAFPAFAATPPLPDAPYELDLTAKDDAACRAACSADPRCHSRVFDRGCLLKEAGAVPMSQRVEEKGFAMRDLPAKHAAYWRALKLPDGRPLDGAPLEDRVLPMPRGVMDFLRAANALQGYPEVPVAAVVTPDYAADFRKALAGLPDSVKKKVAARFSAVLLASDVGSTALTDSIVDGERQVSAFTALDVLKTNVAANEWATNKESSPFKPSKGWKLTATIEDPAGNTRANAIQYILLHEFGHVLAMGTDAHPRWDQKPSTSTRAGDYPFFAQSWTVGPDGQYQKTGKDAAVAMPPLRFYQPDSSPLTGPAMDQVYRRLEETGFVTLYGATNPFDDFAEAFVSYVHVVLMKKPYRIVITHDGKVVRSYGSCWDEPRCAPKRKLIEAFLAR